MGRILAATALGVAGLAGLTVALPPTTALASVVLLYLVVVVAVAAIGGLRLGLAVALVSAMVVNFFFVPPIHKLNVERGQSVITLLVYAGVAITVAVAVDLASRQRAAAARTDDRARALAEVDRVRTALLTAVGHDLRTPLAGIKAGVSSLRDPQLEFSDAQRAELLATVEESTDRMEELVENLLAMSRLQAGAMSVLLRPVLLDEVVAAALLHTPGARADVGRLDDLPEVMADPGLLERALANVIANAQRVSPSKIEIRAAVSDRRVELLVIDHGPGVPVAQRERIFAPFQRLDDTTGVGLGLGLAIARGFMQAMGGAITPTGTPGGGLTMVLRLPIAGDRP
jgi:two-component system sensor histidine kinase KdpD